jgi:putative ABC transport system permease protein
MAMLTVVFAGVALCLSVIGLYSVLAHVVAQRTAEIGIRMALGASRGQVVAMVVRSGSALVGIGLALGVALAAALSGVLRQQLFEVEPLNAGIYVAVSAVFAAAAALACTAPSWRASRVDPVIAFRRSSREVVRAAVNRDTAWSSSRSSTAAKPSRAAEKRRAVEG